MCLASDMQNLLLTVSGVSHIGDKAYTPTNIHLSVSIHTQSQKPPTHCLRQLAWTKPVVANADLRNEKTCLKKTSERYRKGRHSLGGGISRDSEVHSQPLVFKLPYCWGSVLLRQWFINIHMRELCSPGNFEDLSFKLYKALAGLCVCVCVDEHVRMCSWGHNQSVHGN